MFCKIVTKILNITNKSRDPTILIESSVFRKIDMNVVKVMLALNCSLATKMLMIHKL